MKISNYILYGFIGIIFFSYILPGIIFPTDILNYFSSFSQSLWQKPHNSLLADPVFQFEPWRVYIKGQLLSGNIPVWNPLNGSGAPFIANPQTAIFYPLNIIYYLFPTKISLTAIPLFKIFFFSLFSYLYLRSVKCSKFASILSSMAVSFSGFFAVWLLWPHTNVYLLFPLLLFLTEKIRSKNSTPLLISIAFVYFMGVLGGHPETLFHIAVVHQIYTLIRIRKKIVFIKMLVFATLGIGLAGFSLVPFLEYLAYSYILQFRLGTSNTTLLPIPNILLYLFPLLFGAPHTNIYIPSISSSNFQESIGGYVGLIPLVLSAMFIRKLRDGLVNLWLITIGIIFVLSYNFWPLSIIRTFPPFNLSADIRLISILGFGIAVVFARVVTFLENRNKISTNRFLGLILISVFLLIVSYPMLRLFKVSEQLARYSNYQFGHLLIILTTTFIFLFFAGRYSSKKVLVKLILLVALFLQTGALFISYIPQNKTESYFPSAKWIKVIKNDPNTKVMEVGNPNFPPNLNLIYGFKHVEIDDALEINEYRRAFDKEFPDKNMWGNVNSAGIESLRKFGATHVVSDYDLNTIRIKIQSNLSERIMLGNKKLEIAFAGADRELSSIRIVTLNFNRLNTCRIAVLLIDDQTKDMLSSNTIDCRDIRDNMYFNIPLRAKLEKGEIYRVILENVENSPNDIALLGYKNKPYVELLYTSSQGFTNLWQGKNMFVFKVPNSDEIDGLDNIKIILDNSTNLLFTADVGKRGIATIKKVKYPGWYVKVDNKKVELHEGPFISFNINEGEHLIEMGYFPVSIIAGIVVSLSSFILLMLIAGRFIFGNNRKRLDSIYLTFSRSARKVSRLYNFYFFAITATFSTCLFILFSILFKASFKIPKTTAINWFTVNSYPKQQEHFYFTVGLLFIIVIPVATYIIYLWRKAK